MTKYEGYGWIKVKRYKEDDSLDVGEELHALQQHHVAETTFLVGEVRELAGLLERAEDLLSLVPEGEGEKLLSEIRAKIH